MGSRRLSDGAARLSRDSRRRRADDVADAIALQTGELFKTTEITADGGAPRFSPDGRYFTYEVGRGASRRTRLAKTDAPVEPLAELGGYGAAFSPDGTGLAYLKLDPTSEMRELETSIETAETAERTKLSARLSGLTESAARITVRDLASGSERTVETGTLAQECRAPCRRRRRRIQRQRERWRRADLRRAGRRCGRGGNLRRHGEGPAGRQCSGHRGDLHSPRAGPARRRRRRARRRNSASWRCRLERRRSSPGRRRPSRQTAGRWHS